MISPEIKSLRHRPSQAPYGKGDFLVLIGELLPNGYANGLVEEARRLQMTVIRSTVGRRDPQGSLRPLSPEELSQQTDPIINIPLEAGFDLEPNEKGLSPCDFLKSLKMKDWSSNPFQEEDLKHWENSGRKRFQENLKKFIVQLEKSIPRKSRVVFGHIMAGGVPRAKVLMPVMNRVFKGRGERFVPSQALFDSPLGKFCQRNFKMVTAQTFKELVELTSPLRDQIESQGGQVSYIAYGYHGTKVLVDEEYRWQTYTPYFQGWAKMELENYCKKFMSQGISCTVFNCPEILTQSSNIFQGVEVSLYPLLGALKKQSPLSSKTKNLLDQCQNRLKEEHNFQEICSFTSQYMKDERILKHSSYTSWPQHNSQEQMEYMLNSSDHLISMHKNPKELMTQPLSHAIFRATGSLILHSAWKPVEPVLWLGHDIIAQEINT